ncbi:MAG: hypothetical protein KC503_06125 [Myxococcales bacterium]|nr:hypothetical protein [Myxococcales bacterium]
MTMKVSPLRWLCMSLFIVALVGCSDDDTPTKDGGADGIGVDMKVGDASRDGPGSDADGPSMDGPVADQGQWTSWSMKMGGSGRIVGVGHDSSSNTIIAGVFSNDATFGTTTLTAAGNMPALFVAKLDSAGSFSWAMSIGASLSVSGLSALSFAVDASGNSYLSGNTSGAISLAGKQLDRGSFVAKISPAGAVLWAVTLTGGGADFSFFNHGFRGIAVDGSGNVYATGAYKSAAVVGTTTLPSASVEGIFVAKIAADGSLTWVKTPTGRGRGVAIALDGSGNGYVLGSFVGQATFGTTTLDAPALTRDFDIFVAKIDAAGTFGWAKSAGMLGDDGDPSTKWGSETPLAIGVDGSANAYIAGMINGQGGAQATFGTHSVTAGANDENTIFVAKLDSSGSFTWAKASQPSGKDDQLAGFTVDSAGASYLTGTTEQTTFGTHAIAAGVRRLFVSKLDSGGTFQWAIAAITQAAVSGRCIMVDGGVSTVGGDLAGAATFGSETITPPPPMFLVKVSPDGRF